MQIEKQGQVFAASEGDRWFERNKSALEQLDEKADLPLKLMELYHLSPRSVCEVGAANGFRLAMIRERYGCRVVGTEPSAAAIADGEARFPGVEFVQSLAHDIPLKEKSDLVIVNFVFHWVDRGHLLSAVCEVDRLLGDGGFLLIGDFYPSNRVKVRYHHLAEAQVYAYKQDYAAVFMASGLYHAVGLVTAGHSSRGQVEQADEGQRRAVWLLRKMLDGHYVEGALPQ